MHSDFISYCNISVLWQCLYIILVLRDIAYYFYSVVILVPKMGG